MNRFVEGFKLAQSIENANINIYSVYCELTEHTGLRHLLNVLIDAAESHLEELESIRHTIDLNSAVDDTKNDLLYLEDLDIEYAFDASLEYIKFLESMIHREEAITEIYDRLSNVASDTKLVSTLRRFAEDGRKHLWLVRSRYDLETM
jgi:rubrerythrin